MPRLFRMKFSQAEEFILEQNKKLMERIRYQDELIAELSIEVIELKIKLEEHRGEIVIKPIERLQSNKPKIGETEE